MYSYSVVYPSPSPASVGGACASAAFFSSIWYRWGLCFKWQSSLNPSPDLLNVQVEPQLRWRMIRWQMVGGMVILLPGLWGFNAWGWCSECATWGLGPRKQVIQPGAQILTSCLYRQGQVSSGASLGDVEKLLPGHWDFCGWWWGRIFYWVRA